MSLDSIPKPDLSLFDEEEEKGKENIRPSEINAVPKITPDQFYYLMRTGCLISALGSTQAQKDLPIQLFVVDCRYPDEYQFGHINGAINVTTNEIIEQFFSEQFIEKMKMFRNIIVFHCEFSQYRGPRMAALFRTIDRNKNYFSYPHLTYPEVFVLDGGFRKTFHEHPDICCGKYVPMINVSPIILKQSEREQNTIVQKLTSFAQCRYLTHRTSFSQCQLFLGCKNIPYNMLQPSASQPLIF